jgi:hypothetical protein
MIIFVSAWKNLNQFWHLTLGSNVRVALRNKINIAPTRAIKGEVSQLHKKI